MDKRTEESIKSHIITGFPGLADDENFKLTSPVDSNYNCIAWAYNYKDRWMWPHDKSTSDLDGVCYWPDGILKEPDVQAFKEAFQLKGYEVCDNPDFEPKYQKIALYVVPGTTECTHASRQLRNGFWTSKLGQAFDIQHGTPYTIEGTGYGEVHCIMRRLF
ncbi:hypothetical protein [Bacteroides graminisolvens]|uniref:DUF7689 domain-containing protein n=1 Tax=Bacteroides graminisolvens TaxID=477666 RepID=UPI0029C7FD9C|nr:hypothetical protein [Bacteroides graminisolvens]